MHGYPLEVKAGLAVTLLTLLLAAATPAQAETLREVFERAWANSPQGRTAEAKRDEVAASRTVAESWVPAAPKIDAFHRTDRWNSDLGNQESEIGISIPLWLPGQKAARRSLAEADGEENEGDIQATRLAVAGELRRALWTLVMARSEAEIAAERLKTALGLEADVGRRLKVGEIARSDLLLARQETASARAAAADAQLGAVRSLQRYRVLTGTDRLPDDPLEPLAGADNRPVDPRIAAGQAVIERARAALKVAQESRREAPSVGLLYRRDRDVSGATPRDSIGFAISIPLAVEVRNAPLMASANTTLIEAEARYRRLLAEVDAELREAEAQLESAALGAVLAVDREQAAVERLALMRRSFELGETSLVELLRAQSQTTEARIEGVRSRSRLSAAQANLNQARGITP
ncbi:Outer membrane efflux protein [Candidatus Accumulibacter aalborgensis]|uniref:Outer membrane efflux protein n=1 Tax=Candidatus Accumulibacter aalborgensis TaxID=1860102 RepID=A0A1A8XYW5_9PROT|nr:TolC family protein [Candidatus Accumulibacter aalborgensis]SBT09253.1 Outer membrane efflux protein [Candidatus Accumulibacter aalborgensis]